MDKGCAPIMEHKMENVHVRIILCHMHIENNNENTVVRSAQLHNNYIPVKNGRSHMSR